MGPSDRLGLNWIGSSRDELVASPGFVRSALLAERIWEICGFEDADGSCSVSWGFCPDSEGEASSVCVFAERGNGVVGWVGCDRNGSFGLSVGGGGRKESFFELAGQEADFDEDLAQMALDAFLSEAEDETACPAPSPADEGCGDFSGGGVPRGWFP